MQQEVSGAEDGEVADCVPAILLNSHGGARLATVHVHVTLQQFEHVGLIREPDFGAQQRRSDPGEAGAGSELQDALASKWRGHLRLEKSGILT